MRVLLAFAAVALLIVVWLPSRGAPRATVPVRGDDGASVTTESAASPETGEEMGRGEEEGDAGARRMTVVSRRDGSPIAGAQVLDMAGSVQGVSRSDGIAVFRGEGDVWRVTAPGYYPVVVRRDAADWVSLPPAAAITGRVLDAASREPVARVAVELWAGDMRGSEEALTDGAGRFELAGALWQEFWLVARKEGFVPVEREGTLTGPLRDIEIALAAGATLEGRVFDIPDPSHVYLTAGGEPVRLLRSEVDKDGAYRIDGVPLGIEVVPQCDGCCGSAATLLRAGEVQTRDIREAVAMATLLLTLRDPEGNAVKIDSASLREAGSGFVPGRPFRVPPGRYRLEVRAAGWVPHRQEVALAAGSSSLDIVLEGGLAIEGRIVEPTGSPVRGYVSWWDGTDSGGVQTGTDGAFRIRGLSSAPVNLNVGSLDFADTDCEGVVPGGTPVLITLLPLARIVGRLAGTPADDVEIEMWSEQFMGAGATVIEPGGRFEISLAYLGEPSVAMVRRGDGAPLLLDIPALAAGQVHDLGEVRLDPGRTVRGSVRLPDGPARGALVRLDEPWVTQADMSVTRTDAEGRFCLLRMPRRALFVRVEADGFPSHLFRVEEDAVELRLSTGGVVVGRGHGSAAPVVRSRWFDAESTALEPAANGEFRVRLQSGEYDGWLSAAAEGPYEEVRFSIREGETTRIEPRPR